MPIYNPSYIKRLPQELIKHMGSPKSYATEVSFLNCINDSFKDFKGADLFLFRPNILETEGCESFESFCLLESDNKYILNFTQMFYDPQVDMDYSDLNKSSQIARCMYERLGLDSTYIEFTLRSFLQGNQNWIFAFSQQKAQESRAKSIVFMEYPKIIKDIALKQGVPHMMIDNQAILWVPFNNDSNIKCFENIVPLTQRYNKFILIGAYHPIYYPVRQYVRNLELDCVYIRERPLVWGVQNLSPEEGLCQLKNEHISYYADIQAHRFSICTPSIVELPVCKYYESMVVGSIVVTPRFKYMEDYGLIDRETCIVFDPLGDIKAQFDQISNIDIKTLEQIQLNAFNYVMNVRTIGSTINQMKQIFGQYHKPNLRI